MSVGADITAGGVGDSDCVRGRKQLYPCFSTTCQLRCDYCVSNMFLPGAQGRPSLLAEIGVPAYMGLLAPILDHYGPLDVFLGGPGEPLISPWFRGLAEGFLDDGHHVHVTTNALEIGPLVALGAPPRLTVTACYHRGPLANRPRVRAQALENIAALAGKGTLREVLVPLSPAALVAEKALTDELIVLAARGARIRLRRLAHHDALRRYPESYTPHEVAAIERLLAALRGSQMHPAGAPALLPHLGCPLELRNARCYAPAHILNIGLDGGLWNCFAQPFRPRAQGHLTDYDVEAVYADGPVACAYDECACRVVGTTYCLEAHGVSLEDYCTAYHHRAGNRAAVRAIVAS